MNKIDINTKTIKAEVIIQVTSAFWFLIKLFSYKLWLSSRFFPLSPISKSLENIPNSIHLTLLTVFFVCILLVVFFPNKKYLIKIVLLVEIISCCLDQNRWQPYEYQFILTFIFYAIYFNNKKQFINYFCFLLLIIYFNSGLHKLNGAFLYTVWENMILHRFLNIEYEQIKGFGLYIHYSGLFLGIVESLAALGLLFTKTQKVAALFLIVMHIFILAMISPLGLNYNAIVWPWNILMILLLYLVFVHNKSQLIFLKNLVKGLNFIPFIVVGILPFFCFVGLWDNFLSFNLYSGGTKYLEICLKTPENLNNKEIYVIKKGKICNNNSAIQVQDWSLKELNITVYPERRVLIDIINKWKQNNPNCNAVFHIYSYPYKKENIETFE